MSDVRRNLRIMFFVVLIFIFNKLYLRPYILENEFQELLDIFVLSFPNLCEAVIGSLIIVNISLFVKFRFLKQLSNIEENHIYLFSIVAAGVYVLLQEFKIHNLGGNNVYDPFDILFSLIGLVTVYFILLYIKPTTSLERKPKK